VRSSFLSLQTQGSTLIKRKKTFRNLKHDYVDYHTVTTEQSLLRHRIQHLQSPEKPHKYKPKRLQEQVHAEIKAQSVLLYQREKDKQNYQ